MSVQVSPPTEEQTEPPSAPQEALSQDEIFHILQTQRRRDALRYLKMHENPVEMRDLAEQVAAWENDTTVQALTSAERQRVYIALYQSHLPKLDRQGIIDYNQSRGVVERAELASQFDPYLKESVSETTHARTEPTPSDVAHPEPVVESTESAPKWLNYYHGVTAVGAMFLTAAWLDAPLVSLVPDLVWGAILVAVYTTISVAQFAANAQ